MASSDVQRRTNIVFTLMANEVKYHVICDHMTCLKKYTKFDCELPIYTIFCHLHRVWNTQYFLRSYGYIAGDHILEPSTSIPLPFVMRYLRKRRTWQKWQKRNGWNDKHDIHAKQITARKRQNKEKGKWEIPRSKKKSNGLWTIDGWVPRPFGQVQMQSCRREDL